MNSFEVVPPRFKNAKPDVDEVFNWFKDEDRSTFLILCGPVGTGKSWQQWGIWNFARDTDRVFWRFPDLSSAARDFKRAKERDAYRVLEYIPATAPRLLLLDDLGAEEDAGHTRETLWRVVDNRHLLELPTVISTNFLPDQFSERFGDRVADRLTGSDSTLVLMEGKSRREV